MHQKNFKKFFLDNVSGFLWRQWSYMGAAGGSLQEDNWAIDPEALLVYSLPVCRYEPRLFDEIIDWLIINGKFIDIQRLRSVLQNKDIETRRLVSSTACYVSKKARSYRRKWEPLSLLEKKIPGGADEILFITPEGKPFPEPKNFSKIFFEYGFIRDEISPRGMSKPVPVNPGVNMRFLLRSLFGAGARAECILYLLTHELGRPPDIAQSAGASSRAVQDALIELSESGLVHRRIIGKRSIEYRLPHNSWQTFLSGAENLSAAPPLYLNWIALFSALDHVLEALIKSEKAQSAYMRSSKLRQSMQTVGDEFSASGIALPPMPGQDSKPAEFERQFINFILTVLGANEN